MTSFIQTYYTWRLGLRFEVFPERRWKNATVPYHISHKYSMRSRFSVSDNKLPCILLTEHHATFFLFVQGSIDRETIQTALYTIGLMTCIDFVPYDGDAEDYLLIWPVEEPAG